MADTFTPRYQIRAFPEGFLITFFCDLTDFCCIVGPVAVGTPEEALEQGRELARRHFNRCRRCGRPILYPLRTKRPLRIREKGEKEPWHFSISWAILQKASGIKPTKRWRRAA